ncbi:copper methylamine oxidase precursor [Pyrenophora tritici-repentis Pt-1C-BFP]|uniref:Amine oxidase n=1 Tax=Pyrenophora tritici-repentis (strain Pt-1C-BFP) TaxID=426418 RepID=B2VU88_PYRTR|nr:copper methylamine oxidase precursor [Pyrenophora tritici-repentis Pt-1C-BFP]EDU41499.1 copper methylamine oxidase precursor [Pyrenophora tritici-repentis Pt-1C-BFP]
MTVVDVLDNPELRLIEERERIIRPPVTIQVGFRYWRGTLRINSRCTIIIFASRVEKPLVDEDCEHVHEQHVEALAARHVNPTWYPSRKRTGERGSSRDIVPLRVRPVDRLQISSTNSNRIRSVLRISVISISTPIATNPVPRNQMSASSHPLAPLSASEIKNAAAIIKASWPAHTELYYKAITLQEPPKTEVLKYLEAEHNGKPLPAISRKAFINYYIRNTNKFHEAIVDLTSGRVDRNVLLGPFIHANGDGEEIIAIEKVALEDEKVKAEIAKLELPKGTVVISDPWIYGSDGIGDEERLYQCFLYLRDPMNPSEADSNHYAMPLPISPVVSTATMKVIRVDILPTGADNTIKPVGKYKIQPPNEYIPEAQKLRTDLKPLNVVQPEGASFQVQQQGTSNVISWQKWTFRVGFNQREGMVLYDVRYDNRNLFYRLSLSDMNIPYADPRHPYFKKSAFDLGDAGAGIMANNLKLGCDCLGSIYYLSSVLSDDKGGVLDMPNVVCIHEQDAGIGFKHTNYRTGRAVVARSRELVLQSIITVSNYEYILAFIFNQAGELEYEIRATGILSTQPIDEGVEVPFGTVVHPGTLAPHHQHIFSLRIDPMIDGYDNRLVYDEAFAMPRSEWNPHGTGYYVKETVVEKSGGYDIDYDNNRSFKICNPNSRNPVNGKAVAYKIQAPPFQKILSDKDSFNYKRAEFSDHTSTSVEDFPGYACEVLSIHLKPVNFFDKNPALDVPPSEQAFNKSNLLSEQHQQPSVTATVGENGGTEELIIETLGRVGQVNNFRLVYDKETGRPKGFGFAEFADADAAASAVRNLNDYDLMGRKLRVDWSNESGSGDNAPSNRDQGAPPAMNGQQAAPAAAQPSSALGPLPPGVELPPNLTCPDAISRTLSTLPPDQLLDILSQMKGLVMTDPAKATELLRQAPQLAYAIFQSLLLLQLVDPAILTSLVETSAAPAPVAPAPPVQQVQQPPPQVTRPPMPYAGYPPQVAPTPPQPQAPQPYTQPPQQQQAPAMEQQAIYAQVMALTQQQIDALTPEYRNQIIAIRQAIMAGGRP